MYHRNFTKLIRLLGFLSIICLFNTCKDDPPHLSANPSSLNFTQGGGSSSVNVSSNVDWNAVVSGSGFSVSPSSGHADGTLTVTAAPATSPEPLTGTLTVTAGELSATVSLSMEAKNTLIVGADKTDFDAAGGTLNITVQHNVSVDYSIESSARSWISHTGTKALSTSTLSFAIAPNDTYDARSGKITLKDKTGIVADQVITVNQKQSYALILSVRHAEIAHEGGLVEVNIQHSTSGFDYACSDSWISKVDSKGLNEKNLYFAVADNASDKPRSGKILFTASEGNLKDSLCIDQQAKYFSISHGATDFDYTGGTLSVSVKHNVPYSCLSEAAADWIKSTSKTEEGDTDTWVFTLAANDTYEARETSIEFKEETGVFDPVRIPVVQTQEYVISVTPKYFELPYEGGLIEVEVKYSTPYEMLPSEPWIQPVETKTIGSGKVSFSIPETFAEEKRKGEIVFRTLLGNAADTVRFVQAPGGTQRIALIDIYKALDGENWTKGKNARWCSLEPIEKWQGVSVENGAVIALDLSDCGLKGDFPEAITQLQGLRILNLSQNKNLSGSLPEDLSKCLYLHTLLIDRTSIGGTLPAAWTTLRALKTLSAYQTALTTPIPDELFASWTALSELLLYDNAQFTGSLPSGIASMAGREENLNVRLENCNFDGSIPAAWDTLPANLSSLRIQGNRLAGQVSRKMQKHANWDLWEPEQYILPQRNGKLKLERVAPQLSDVTVGNILGTTASFSAHVTDNGGQDPDFYGFYVNDTQIAAVLKDGIFTATASGLLPSTSYTVRACATNVAGTGVGAPAEFTTASPPGLSEVAVSELTGAGARFAASITADGGDGNISRYGFLLDNKELVASNLSDKHFSLEVNNLSLGTAYSIKAFAQNSAGKGYGGEVNFTTPKTPEVSAVSVSNITPTMATLSASIIATGGLDVSERGFYINHNKQAVASGEDAYSLNLTDLAPASDYTVQAYAVNRAGTAYGPESSFSTPVAIALDGAVRSGSSGVGNAKITFVKMDPATTASGTKADVFNEARMRPLSIQDIRDNLPAIVRLLSGAIDRSRGRRAAAAYPATHYPVAVQTAFTETYTATTRTGGSFTIQNMSPGLYGVRIEASGYVSFYTRITLTPENSNLTFEGMKKLDGAVPLQWFKNNPVTRIFTAPGPTENISATIAWDVSHLNNYTGKKLHQVYFYPTAEVPYLILVINSTALVADLAKALEKIADLGSDPNVLAIIKILTPYAPYIFMVEEKNLTLNQTNVFSYDKALIPSQDGIPVLPNEGFLVNIIATQKGSGVLMTDGEGPAVADYGNTLKILSNENINTLTDMGYAGNWHIGITLK